MNHHLPFVFFVAHIDKFSSPFMFKRLNTAKRGVLDTSAPIAGDVRDAEWLKRHVLSSEGFVRRIASFV